MVEMYKECPLCKKEKYKLIIPEEWPHCDLCEIMKGGNTNGEWWKRYDK